MPIEHLAQLLVQYARADATLPRRTPANDDAQHARYVDDMFNRIEALPELRRETQAMQGEPQVASPVVPTEPASNEDLEELVAIALTSAQDAEDISRDAYEASRKARRGMFVAIVLAAAGIAITGAATISARLSGGESQQMADIARQVQTLGDLQRHINDRLADLHSAASVQQAPVQQASDAPAATRQPSPTAPPPLTPLNAVPVSVLPAEAAVSPPASATTDASQPVAAAPLPSTEAPAASFAPAAAYTAYPPPPLADYQSRTAYHGTWTSYHPRPRHDRTIVLPRPMAYLIGTVRRDVRTVLR